MNSDFDKFFNVLSHVFSNLDESFGGAAAVLFGLLLLAGIFAGGLMTYWIFRGGWSRPAQDLFRERQAIECYFRDT